MKHERRPLLFIYFFLHPCDDAREPPSCRGSAAVKRSVFAKIVELVVDLSTRELAKKYLDDLDRFLDTDGITLQLSDALFPFVRQFANHDRTWFDNQYWANLHDWLSENLESEAFSVCMKKYPQWHEGDDVVTFPPIE